jgi:hypothetical protein
MIVTSLREVAVVLCSRFHSTSFTRLYRTRRASGNLPQGQIIEFTGSPTLHEQFLDGHPGKPVPFDGPVEYEDDVFKLDNQAPSMIPNAPLVDYSMDELKAEYDWETEEQIAAAFKLGLPWRMVDDLDKYIGQPTGVRHRVSRSDLLEKWKGTMRLVCTPAFLKSLRGADND